MKKWKAVKAKARVIASAAKAPATPTKPPTTPTKSKKKKPQTPKKKKFFYAVAIGKVPGVYDSWIEAERQVRFYTIEYKENPDCTYPINVIRRVSTNLLVEELRVLKPLVFCRRIIYVGRLVASLETLG